jgi:hypothetical protein
MGEIYRQVGRDGTPKWTVWIANTDYPGKVVALVTRYNRDCASGLSAILFWNTHKTSSQMSRSRRQTGYGEIIHVRIPLQLQKTVSPGTSSCAVVTFCQTITSGLIRRLRSLTIKSLARGKCCCMRLCMQQARRRHVAGRNAGRQPKLDVIYMYRTTACSVINSQLFPWHPASTMFT